MINTEEVTNRVVNYIDTKKRITLCKQKHFKQLCQRCKEYSKCGLYADHVDSWIKLQGIIDNNYLELKAKRTVE